MLRLKILSIFLLSPFIIFAQNGNSPYSNIGLGDPISEEYINNTGMGGVSMAMPTAFHINANPAFLSQNTRYTTFELGGAGEYKRLSTTRNSVKDGNGSLRYLAFAFPIAKRYVLNIGLRPLTNVSYNYSRTDTIPNSFGEDTIRYSFSGDGGINSVYLAHGIKITDALSLGLKTAYNFGAINKYYSSYSADIGQPYSLQVKHQTNYRGFLIAPSVGYRQHLNKEWYLNAGAMYEIESRWNYTNNRSVIKRSPFDNSPLNTDTLGVENKGKIFYPSTLRIGVSIEKNYKWIIGGEFKYQDWQKFKSVDGSEALKNVTSLSLGGQYIPNLNAIKGYLNRVIFRFGVYYNQNNYSLSNTVVADRGASIGLSLPVGRLSFVNLAFSAGQRGDKGTNLVQENYYRFNLGVTLNDRWFVRSKYD